MPLYNPPISSTALAADVATSETTTSTSYTGLATAQAVTITVGGSGKLLVGYGADMSNSGVNFNLCSVALSGANTVAASDNWAVVQVGLTEFGAGITKTFTGLTPGSTTVTMQFRTTGGTLTALRRVFWAMPL